MSASPTDTSFPSPPSSPTSSSFDCSQTDSTMDSTQSAINEIMHKLSEQSLQSRETVEFAPWATSPPPSRPPSSHGTDEQMPYTSSSASSSSTSLPNLYAVSNSKGFACRRLQRQLNVQLQSSATHIRDIQTLFEEMVASNSHCLVHKPSSTSYRSSPPPPRPSRPVGLIVDPMDFDSPPIPDITIDEGFHEPDHFEEEITFRRASAPSGIRKYNTLKWSRSANCVVMGGRLIVRSVPRMRKRRGPNA